MSLDEGVVYEKNMSFMKMRFCNGKVCGKIWVHTEERGEKDVVRTRFGVVTGFD